MPGDYDGDGITDRGVYDTATGNWFIDETAAGHQIHPSFGGTGYVPVPGDYDGDGQTDIAVYEENTGAWCYVGSTSGIACQAAFGGSGYIPVPGDYDGDGTTDLAVYDEVAGHWFIIGSTDGLLIQPILKTIAKHAHIVTLTQHLGNFIGFDRRGDQKKLPLRQTHRPVIKFEFGPNIINRFVDGAIAPQIIIQR